MSTRTTDDKGKQESISYEATLPTIEKHII